MSARDPSADAHWKAWVRKAESDLLNIENNLVAPNVPWDTICFHAQQAVEKLLKAWMISRGTTPRRTHDLVALLAECVALEPALASLESDCRLLTAYAIQSRYPDDVYEVSEADARHVLSAAQRARQAISESLPLSNE